MKLEENNNINEQQKSLDQIQEKVAIPQSQEELLEAKVENVEKLVDSIDDISPAELAEIKNLGGDEEELAEELIPVDQEITRTRSEFIDRAKNYVIGLATMMASVGNMSGANTDQKVKDKAEANVVYVDNKDDARLKAYQDSSALYNNYIDLKSKLKSQNYEKKKQAFYNSPQEALADKAKHDKEHIDGVNPIPTKVTQKTETLKSVNDFIGGVVNPTLPEQLFSDSIKPSGMEQYDHNDDIGTVQRIFSNVDDKKEFIKNNAYGDTRIIANYSNVKPKVEVKLKQTPETKPVVKKVNTQEKKTNKTESQIIYVENKKDPRLVAYQDSLALYKESLLWLQNMDKSKDKFFSEEEAKKQILKDHGRLDLGGTNSQHSIMRWLIPPSITKPEYGSLQQDWGSFNDYVYDKKDSKSFLKKFLPIKFFNAKDGGYEYEPVYKKPVVEVKYRPKPKLTEVKLNPKDLLHIPLEKNEENPLANLKQKEIIKAPEKTGYTVRVGSKLYYMSKEDADKLEADKTTHYNITTKGDGTEKHLVWNYGNEQGQTLEQVTARLGIKLPIAFDTQEQKFDKE
jgi:hypothetical protein